MISVERSPLARVLAALDKPRPAADRAHWRAPCPAHDGRNRSTLSVGEGEAGAVLLKCFAGCSADSIAAALGMTLAELFPESRARTDTPGQAARRSLRSAPVAPRAAAADLLHETLSPIGVALWDSVQEIRGTVAEHYLTSRQCVLPPADGDLRFHPALRHPGGYVGPALLALITDARSGARLSLHRTWIVADGTKPAEADPARLLLRGHRKAGGVIRLWPDEAVTTGLGIAEGIETALSLAHGMQPVWACIDAGNLSTFAVLDGVESLTIAADHDPAGNRAAEQCAQTWYGAGREVRIVRPPEAGTDLNDIARQQA